MKCGRNLLENENKFFFINQIQLQNKKQIYQQFTTACMEKIKP